MSGIKTKIESIRKKQKQNSSNVIQLPLWGEMHRAAPSCVLRSALFGVVKRGKRVYLERQELAAWGNDSISYTGQRLDQSDLDVWLELLHLSRDAELGKTVEFEKYAMLKKLGRSTGSSDWKWLESSLTRMCASCVHIKSGRKVYFGSLIEKGFIDEETGRYVVVLNAELSDLFDASYTLQHSEKRKALKQDLTKWLCGYVESQKATKDAPHRIAISSLYKLCGSERKQLRDFKRDIKESIRQLIESGIIEAGLVSENDVFQFYKR